MTAKQKRQWARLVIDLEMRRESAAFQTRYHGARALKHLVAYRAACEMEPCGADRRYHFDEYLYNRSLVNLWWRQRRDLNSLVAKANEVAS